jgi:hypothetical protein
MINLGFLLRENLAAVLIIPSSWGSQLDGEKPSTPCRIKTFFWRRCRGIEEEEAPTSTTHSHVNLAPSKDIFLAPLPGKKKTSRREFRTHILYFVLSFALLYFCLHHFIKNTKN